MIDGTVASQDEYWFKRGMSRQGPSLPSALLLSNPSSSLILHRSEALIKQIHISIAHTREFVIEYLSCKSLSYLGQYSTLHCDKSQGRSRLVLMEHCTSHRSTLPWKQMYPEQWKQRNKKSC